LLHYLLVTLLLSSLRLRLRLLLLLLLLLPVSPPLMNLKARLKGLHPLPC
jgi:hypothetical protein